MKTFTALEFKNNPQKVYRTADREGSCKINHDRYSDRIFILQAKDRGDDWDDRGNEQPSRENKNI